MALVLAREEAKPSTFDQLFDGVGARYCHIDGKYYISVRDLIIGMCVESPKKDGESWNAACKYASQAWQKTITPSDKEELSNHLQTFQFEGNIHETSFLYIKPVSYNIRNLFLYEMIGFV
jgi:hypothetical protein